MTTSSPKSRQSPQKNSSPIKAEEPSALSQTNNVNNISRPSAEDLVDLDRELQKLIARKIQADTNLVKLETRIYDLETEYLTETHSFGNLIHGIEGYLGLPPAAPVNAPMRRGPLNNSTSSLPTLTSQSSTSSSINPQQRIFSSTSMTFQKSLALAGRVSEAIANGYALPTVSESSSDLTSINGLRSKAQENKKSSSPTKKSNGSSSKPPQNSSGVNKTKKSDSSEWQPPSMKSSRKK